MVAMTPESPSTPAVVGSPDTRTITLPDGQRLFLRPVSGADAADLTRLYGTLTLDDEYRRCSTIAGGPGAVERMATVAERGGFGLVATLSATRLDRQRLLGAGSYELLANGDGGLSLIVAREWRWWLQRLLLHALLEAARRRSVPNLEVDARLTDQALLGFARSRGCAFMRSERQWSVRCVMGTGGPTATWPGVRDRPRVLVETPTAGWRTDPAFTHPDWQVLACPGPDERACPTLGGQVCRLAAGADAVVVAPRPGDRHWPALTAAHRSQHPGVPVFVRSSAPGSPPPDAPGWLSADRADGRADRALIDQAARTHARRTDGWVGVVPPELSES
jgi:hypothetical protein